MKKLEKLVLSRNEMTALKGGDEVKVFSCSDDTAPNIC